MSDREYSLKSPFFFEAFEGEVAGIFRGDARAEDKTFKNFEDQYLVAIRNTLDPRVCVDIYTVDVFVELFNFTHMETSSHI